ncbi:MAG: DNA-processing protein DprA [Bacillota bacterium]
MREERAFWLAISLLPGITAKNARRLRAHFPDASSIWKASGGQLSEALGWGPERMEGLLAKRQQLDPPALLARVERAGAWVQSMADPEYPRQLTELFDPPIVLYGWGAPLDLRRRRLAIVGSRRMTGYGRQVLMDFMADFSKAELAIVSGLARGIDGQAHRSALENGLLTWAVLGSGFSHIYPREHRQLAMDLIDKGGTIISEYWPEAEPLAYHFPARNRIIAALAEAVLVVEADAKSGSMITVDHALDLGREVFAVPGNITNRFSRGTNLLLKQGAAVAAAATDVLSLWGMNDSQVEKLPLPTFSPIERHVYQLLADEYQEFDRLVQQADLSASELLSVLSSMELKGLAAVDTSQRYRRSGRYEDPDER